MTISSTMGWSSKLTLIKFYKNLQKLGFSNGMDFSYTTFLIGDDGLDGALSFRTFSSWLSAICSD